MSTKLFDSIQLWKTNYTRNKYLFQVFTLAHTFNLSFHAFLKYLNSLVFSSLFFIFFSLFIWMYIRSNRRCFSPESTDSIVLGQTEELEEGRKGLNSWQPRSRGSGWERPAEKIIQVKTPRQTSSCSTVPPVPIWLLIHQWINSTFLTLWIVTLCGSNYPFRGVAYQINCLADIYIKICSNCKIRVMK